MLLPPVTFAFRLLVSLCRPMINGWFNSGLPPGVNPGMGCDIVKQPTRLVVLVYVNPSTTSLVDNGSILQHVQSVREMYLCKWCVNDGIQALYIYEQSSIQFSCPKYSVLYVRSMTSLTCIIFMSAPAQIHRKPLLLGKNEGMIPNHIPFLPVFSLDFTNCTVFFVVPTIRSMHTSIANVWFRKGSVR